jgi:hypothetical protein
MSSADDGCTIGIISASAAAGATAVRGLIVRVPLMALWPKPQEAVLMANVALQGPVSNVHL